LTPDTYTVDAFAKAEGISRGTVTGFGSKAADRAITWSATADESPMKPAWSGDGS